MHNGGNMAEEFYDDTIYTLTDEEGNEEEFALLGSAELEDKIYLALIPAKDIDKADAEFVILRQEKEDGEDVLVTIDDDDEYERIAEIFENEILGDIDYDGESDGN